MSSTVKACLALPTAHAQLSRSRESPLDSELVGAVCCFQGMCVLRASQGINCTWQMALSISTLRTVMLVS